MQVERQVDLAFQSGSSDKVYYMRLLSDGGNNWQVGVAYGKRHACNENYLTHKFPDPGTDHVEASQLYDKLLKQKTAKGYQITAQT